MIDINALSKTEKGREQILREFANCTDGINREIDKKCWDMYNNQHNESEYDYLRKYGAYELPAHVRHVPKQRPFIDWLVSRHINRPFVFDTVAVDKNSLVRKHSNNAAKKADMYEVLYKQKGAVIKAQIQQIQGQMQSVQQQMEQLDPNDPEQAQQMQQLQAMMPQIQMMYEQSMESLSDLQVLNEETMSRLRMMKKYSDRDIMEHWAQVAVRSLRRTLDFKQKSIQNIVNRAVTGKQWYLVDYDQNNKRIVLKSLVPHSVFFQDVNDILWTQDLDWAGYEEYMSPTDVIAEFGDRLSEEQKKSINDSSRSGYGFHNDNRTFVAAPGNQAIDQGMDYRPVSSGGINSQNGIRVKRVWWLADVKPRAIKKVNPYEKGRFFTNILHQDDERYALDEKDFKYDSRERKYTRRDNETVSYPRDKVIPFNSSKGDYLDVRVKYDRYKGVIIDDRIFLSERDIQVRNQDNLSKNYLPIVGPTFNNITQQPYSYIWATKDLQKLYNIVNYHKELMLAISGTKAFLMDSVQKPKGMSDEEWEYKKKLGTIEIETRKTGIGYTNPTFNQFQMIDMSLSSSIQYFDTMLDNIENQIGLIMGITRQAMGQVEAVDQVGTFQMSQRSTLLVTQCFFDNHDEVDRQALMMIMRLAKQFMFDEDTVVQIIGDGLTEELVKIPGKSLREADFEIILQSGSKEENSRAELMNFALQNYKAGMLPYSDFVRLYNTESLKELEIMSRYFDEEARKISAAQREGEAASAEALEEKKGQLAMQLADYTEKMKQRTEAMKMEFDAAKAKSEEQFRAADLELRKRDLELRERELENKRVLEQYALMNKKDSENNELLEKQRATNIDAQIRMIELEIKRISEQLKKDTDNKKINVDREKVKNQKSPGL